MLYDITLSFEENINRVSNTMQPVFRAMPDKLLFNLFDFPLASRIGVPACAATTSNGISLLARFGFDILTYKTIRSTPQSAHPLPNIAYVDCNQQLTPQDIGQIVHASQQQPPEIAITNSFGNACGDREWIEQDIAAARNAIGRGQILIVSVFGTDQPNRSCVQDFAYTAQIAHHAGAQIIEANLSCPNLGEHEPLYKNPERVFEISKEIKKVLPQVPLIIKVGYCTKELLEKIMLAIARAGAQGICGINTVPMRVINQNGTPFFGKKREISGISGNPIRSLALDFIQNAAYINAQHIFGLTILGTGGIIKATHFDTFLTAGAHAALSATGTMWNPYLAHEYHDLRRNNEALQNHFTVTPSPQLHQSGS